MHTPKGTGFTLSIKNPVILVPGSNLDEGDNGSNKRGEYSVRERSCSTEVIHK